MGSIIFRVWTTAREKNLQLGSLERLLVIAIFQQTEWHSWNISNKGRIVTLFIKCSCKGNARKISCVNRKWECSYQRGWSWDIVFDGMQYGGSWWNDLCSCKTCFKRTHSVDKDVVVKAIANFRQLVSLNEPCIGFGAIKLLRFIYLLTK